MLSRILESRAIENYVKELVGRTEVKVTGDEISVKCPSCGEIIKFDVETAKDGLALGLSLNNHLYYCLIGQIPSSFLRTRIAHSWSVSVVWRLSQEKLDSKGEGVWRR